MGLVDQRPRQRRGPPPQVVGPLEGAVVDDPGRAVHPVRLELRPRDPGTPARRRARTGSPSPARPPAGRPPTTSAAAAGAISTRRPSAAAARDPPARSPWAPTPKTSSPQLLARTGVPQFHLSELRNAGCTTPNGQGARSRSATGNGPSRSASAAPRPRRCACPSRTSSKRPAGQRQRRAGPVAGQAQDQAGGHGHDVAAPDVGDGVRRFRAGGGQRLVGGAGAEALRAAPAQVQGPLGQQQLREAGVGLSGPRPQRGRPSRLRPAATPGRRSRPGGGCRGRPGSGPTARSPGRCRARPGAVSFSSVWARELIRPGSTSGATNASRAAVNSASPRTPSTNCAQGVVVVGVGVDPAGVLLGLLRGLLHVGHGPLGRQRPGARPASGRAATRRCGRGATGRRGAGRPSSTTRPPRRRSGPGSPTGGRCRARVSSRPLRVVGRRGQQRAGPVPGDVVVARRGTPRGQPEPARVAADLVERHQPVVACRRSCPPRPWPSPGR